MHVVERPDACMFDYDGKQVNKAEKRNARVQAWTKTAFLIDVKEEAPAKYVKTGLEGQENVECS